MANTGPGIVWGSTGDPSQLYTRFSAAANGIDGAVERLVRDMLIEAVAEVQTSIRTRGVKGGHPNHDGRIQSEAMLRSVTYTLSYNRRGRVEGQFGYLRDPPKWAIWQEYGTAGGQGNGRGILAMLALTDAYTHFKVKLEDALRNGSIVNLNQGAYTLGSSTSSPYRSSGGIT